MSGVSNKRQRVGENQQKRKAIIQNNSWLKRKQINSEEEA
jgi:hypothetical protein